MITIQSSTYVEGPTGKQIFNSLLNAADEEYQAWWPGVHLHLHTRKRCPNHVGNIVYMEEFIGEYRVKAHATIIEAIPGKKIVWQTKRVVRLPGWLTLELDDDVTGVSITSHPSRRVQLAT